MLSDADVERYARQIVLPEIGGHGQARLLASRAHVLGDGPASRHAADLLRRAGVQLSDATPSLVVDLRVEAPVTPGPVGAPLVRGRLHGTRATVDVLPAGAPRPRHDAAEHGGTGKIADPSLHACTLRVLGALAASEALVLLLKPRRGAHRTTIDVTNGSVCSGALETPA